MNDNMVRVEVTCPFCGCDYEHVTGRVEARKTKYTRCARCRREIIIDGMPYRYIDTAPRRMGEVWLQGHPRTRTRES